MPFEDSGTTSSTGTTAYGWTREGSAYLTVDDGVVESVTVDEPRNIKGKPIGHPKFYFKYVKKKLKPLQRLKMDSRMKRVEKSWETMMKNGQDALAQKTLNWLEVQTKESAIYAKGVKFFIDKEDLDKFKNKIKEGRISDTRFESYTRHIPDDVLKRKKEVESAFDEFWIYHYFSPKQADVKDMSPLEEEKMRDPILFGKLRNSNRFYFIADWEDEFCTLTFDELLDELDIDNGENTLSHKPEELTE